MKLHVTTFCQSGKAEEECQDRVQVSQQEDGGVLCVLSDGVGSGRDPARCAERVVKLVSDGFAARPRQWSVKKVLQQLTVQINESLYKEGAYLDGTPSMQATLSVIALLDNHLYGLNIGDSPIYRLRQSHLEQLSRSDARKSPDGHSVLSQAMGMGPLLDPHHFESPVAPGDTILVASDGVINLLGSQNDIEATLIKAATARTIVIQAREKTRESDTDDLSAILIRIEELSLPKPSTLEPNTFLTPKKGLIVDGYHLVDPLQGSQRVWIAEKDGVKKVVKFMPQEAETDDSGTIAARFSREIWNTTQITGPEFVPAYPPQNNSGQYYLMDYIPAPSLAKVLTSRKLGIEETVSLGRFLAKAAQVLLSKELIHGDIKPDNVLLLSDGSFKILDLGIASPVFTVAADSGTASYLAPERFIGAVITERTEIFAMGVTLYECLTGRLPFGPIERFQKPEFGVASRPSRYNPNVPLWLDAVVVKCLTLHPANRFQHYSELLFCLDHPEQAPDLSFSGPLLETNPLLFYKILFALFLATTVLLTIALLQCLHH